jgi:hypothetical protein
MAELDKLVVRIDAELGGLRKEMATAARVTEDGGKKMAAGMNTFTAAAGAARAAVLRLGGVLVAAVGVRALVGFAKRSLDAAGGLGEMAQQMGVSTTALQVYQFAAVQAGISTGELQTALAFLTRTIGQAVDGEKIALDAFNRLGIGILDAGGNVRPTEVIFREIAERMKGLPNAAAQARSAIELFSRSGQKLLPILTAGADGLTDFEKKARAAGAVLTEDMIAQADEASDAMAALEFEIAKLAQTMTSKFGPAATAFVRDINNLFDSASLSEQIADAHKELKSLGTVSIFDIDRRAVVEKQLDSLLELQREFARASAMTGTPLPAGPTSNPLSKEDAAKALKGPFAANLTPDMQRRAELAQMHRDAELESLAALQDFNVEQSRGILELERSLQIQTREKELLLRFGGEETEEYRVQAELMRIKNDLGADAAKNAEAEVRSLEKLRTRLNVLTEEQKKAKDAADEMKRTAEDLGMTFTSAFEDAVIAGKGLREVLKGILEDIARIVLREGVTSPAKGFLGDLFSGIIGSVVGGGGGGIIEAGSMRAAGGPVSAHTPYLVGEKGPELFVPETAGSIVPNMPGRAATAMAGGGAGGATVFIDARGADRAALARVERSLARLDATVEHRAVSAMFSARRGGGSVARAFGG